MKKQISTYCILLLLTLGLQAQTISKELISNGGSTYTQNINLEWSLGEIILQNYSPDASATIGFLQGSKTPTSIFDPEIDDQSVIIKPNPSTDYITIVIKDEHQKIQNIKIYSADGVYISSTNNIREPLSISQLHTGVYLLLISFKNGQSTTKKIIKI